jgi:hypothetical protein
LADGLRLPAERYADAASQSPGSGDGISPGWRRAWARRESSHGRQYSTVAELTEAAAAAVGAPGAVPGSDADARARLGDRFAEVLLLDQGTSAAKARSELGWSPPHATLVDEFLYGSYRR